jgi:hypothetical protein
VDHLPLVHVAILVMHQHAEAVGPPAAVGRPAHGEGAAAAGELPALDLCGARRRRRRMRRRGRRRRRRRGFGGAPWPRPLRV